MEVDVKKGLRDAIYISFFLLVVLMVYWMGGQKPAYWLLLLVLFGQVLTHIGEIQNLLKVGAGK